MNAPLSLSFSPALDAARADPSAALLLFIGGHVVSKSVYGVAKLGIADLLADGPRTIAGLAIESGADEMALYRVMRAVATLGFFVEKPVRVFSLGPLGFALQSDHPKSLRSLALSLNEEQYNAYGDILHTLETGDTAFKHAFGRDVFDFYARDPGAAETFNASMRDMFVAEPDLVFGAYDFSSYRRIVDVGGGNGDFLARIIELAPNAEGVLLDTAAAIAEAKRNPILAGSELVVGDFHASVPAGGDLYVLKHVLQDWDNARASAILCNIRSAMAEGARVAVIECMIDPRRVNSTAAFCDAHMLAITGGRLRNRIEFEDLFAASGLTLARMIDAGDGLWIVEAVAA